MSEIERIQKYTERTKIKHDERYCLAFREIMALHQSIEKEPFGTLCLAFDYGRAKGYRAANVEGKG